MTNKIDYIYIRDRKILLKLGPSQPQDWVEVEAGLQIQLGLS